MKNFNKLFGGILLMLGFVGMSLAAGVAISPKNTYELSFSAVVSQATPAISTSSLSQFMPGAVYGIYQSSGAASEYFEMYDSSSTTGITCGMSNATLPTDATMIGPRFIFGSTTANTVTKLDPPVAFYNGLVVCDSTSTGQTSIVYELGRGLSGQ